MCIWLSNMVFHWQRTQVQTLIVIDSNHARDRFPALLAAMWSGCWIGILDALFSDRSLSCCVQDSIQNISDLFLCLTFTQRSINARKIEQSYERRGCFVCNKFFATWWHLGLDQSRSLTQIWTLLPDQRVVKNLLWNFRIIWTLKSFQVWVRWRCRNWWMQR